MRAAALAFTLSLVFASPSFAQQCLHGDGETPEQGARRREALNAARLVNTLQANQPGAASGHFLTHAELPGAAPGLPPTIRLTPGQDIVPGWRLTLDVTPKGYWFAIRDTTDACGLTFVSNEAGLILRAEPIR